MDHRPSIAWSPFTNLLTPVRARILLDLGDEKTMSEIAEGQFISPSTATYQVTILLEADLVYREKRGTTVYVKRSARGSRLIRIYCDDTPTARSA